MQTTAKATFRKPSAIYEFVRRVAITGEDSRKESVQIVRIRHKIGRNDPCPCRSGKKYKHCHLRLENGGR